MPNIPASGPGTSGLFQSASANAGDLRRGAFGFAPALPGQAAALQGEVTPYQGPYAPGREPRPHQSRQPAARPPASRAALARAVFNQLQLSGAWDGSEDQRYAATLGLEPPPGVAGADPDGAKAYYRSLYLRRVLADMPATTHWLGHPAHAAAAAGHVASAGDLERALDLLRHGDVGGYQLAALGAGADLLNQRVLQPAWNRFADKVGAPELHLQGDQISRSLMAVHDNSQHFAAGVAAGVEDDLINNIGVGGIEVAEDVVRRQVVQRAVNLTRKAAGLPPVDLEKDDGIHAQLEALHQGMHALGQWIAPGDDPWTRAGRATGYMGGVLILSVAQPQLAPVLFGLQGMVDAADAAKQAGKYGTDAGDIAIVFNGAAQAILGKVSFGGGAMTAVGNISSPLLKAAAGIGVEALDQSLIGGLSQLAGNVSKRLVDRRQDLLEGVGDAARSSALFGGAMHGAGHAPEALAKLKALWRDASRTVESGRLLDRLAHMAVASKIRGNSTDSFAALVEAAAPDARVYVDVQPGELPPHAERAPGGDPVAPSPEKEAAAAGGPDGAQAPSGSPEAPSTEDLSLDAAKSNASEAVEGASVATPSRQGAVGGKVVTIAIRLSDWLAKVAPTGAHELLKPHTRLDAHGMPKAAAEQVLHDVAALPEHERAAIEAATLPEAFGTSGPPAVDPPTAGVHPDGGTPPGSDPAISASSADGRGETPAGHASVLADAGTPSAPPADVALLPAPEGVHHVEARGDYRISLHEDGRPLLVEGPLKLEEEHKRSRKAQLAAGGKDRLKDDDGGHFIASQFGGPLDGFNHFAQNSNFNRGPYRALEKRWAASLKANKTVHVRIEPTYVAGSLRPSELLIHYTIDGKTEIARFTNAHGGK